jgi:hypothetical protein
MVGRSSARKRPYWPWYGWLGAGLLAAGQVFSLWHWQPLCEYWYGFVWYGLIFVLDAWCVYRHGSSLIVAQPRSLFWMLFYSLSLWWALEGANIRLQVWEYSPSPGVPLWLQGVRSAVFFASLVPATMVVTQACLQLPGVRSLSLATMQQTCPRWLKILSFSVGSLVLSLAFLTTKLALGFGLLGLFLISDAHNAWRGAASLLVAVWNRAWRLPLALWLGNMVSGLMGEFWNFYAVPKWTYHVPFLDFGKVFEMPVLAYPVYALLASTVFALFHALYHWVPDSWRNANHMQVLKTIGFSVES